MRFTDETKSPKQERFCAWPSAKQGMHRRGQKWEKVTKLILAEVAEACTHCLQFWKSRVLIALVPDVSGPGFAGKPPVTATQTLLA